MCAKFLGKELRTRKVNLCINILSSKLRHLSKYLKFHSTLSLVIRIIKEKKERVALSRRNSIKPPLNLENILQAEWMNKKFNQHTSSRQPWTFTSKRNEARCLLINRVICKKTPWEVKNKMFLKQRVSKTGNSWLCS